MHTDATNLCLLLDNFWFRYNLIRTRCLLFYQAKNRRLEIKIFVKIFYSQLIKICYEIFTKKTDFFVMMIAIESGSSGGCDRASALQRRPKMYL